MIVGRRSPPTSDRYAIFQLERRTSEILDRRLVSERRQSQRRKECMCLGRRDNARRAQPDMHQEDMALAAIATPLPPPPWDHLGPPLHSDDGSRLGKRSGPQTW